MTRAELKTAAKEQIRGKIGILFVMLLIIFAIAIACAFIPIVTFIITPAFGLSLCMVYLKLTKKEDISVGDVFSGFNATGKALWLNILISVFTFLWTCLLIIPGIVKQYVYSMAFYILADNPKLTAYVTPYINATTANFYNSIKEA